MTATLTDEIVPPSLSSSIQYCALLTIINMRVVVPIMEHCIHLFCGLITLLVTAMKLLPPIPMSDNCVILFWLLLLLTSINLICFAESVTLLKNESDRLALLAFKDGISNDPNGVLSSWNNSLHFCMWDGVTCSRRHPQRVVALDLSYQSLRGSLSPYIGNLSFLRTIALYNNTLEGRIPQEIGRLFRLQYLELLNNSLDGEIPNNLTNCLQLRFLSLYGNRLTGNIPLDIGSLSNLYWLSLANNNLIGHIPPSLGNLSLLTDLYLSKNSLDGSILQELGRLVKLQNLYLGTNSFNGDIPQNLTQCLQLKTAYLNGNKLVGKIPSAIGSLSKLHFLSLWRNNLIGHIPPSLGNLSLLTGLILPENSLDGSIPQELGRLVNLQYLVIGENRLSGMFPVSLYNLSSIRVLDVGSNHLHGSLSPKLGLGFPNLARLYIGGNRFTGLIPVSLGNASRLFDISAGSNHFSGSLPMNLGRLKGLVALEVSGNQLVNEKNEEFTFITSLTNCSGLNHLDLSYNQFSGILPYSIANISTQLIELGLEENQFFGAIPRGLENLANLILLSLGQNRFTGTIPIHLMKLKRLQGLFMHGNKLSGKIPISIGNLAQLSELNLGGNDLQGSIPLSLGNCQHLQYLNLDDNILSGTIPNQVIHIPTLLEINIGMNHLTGTLPLDIGQSKNLILLNISYNRLSGEIPPSLNALIALQVLDLSHNTLTGHIPSNLVQLLSLQYLNLSFNNFEGEVPKHGIFQNSSAISIIGNAKLCGGIPKLQLPKCPKQDFKKQEGTFSRRVIIIIVVGVVLFSFLLLCFLAFRSKKLREKLISTSSMRKSFLQVTYGELFKATDGFSLANLIGEGSYSHVYKGIIDHTEMIVAIKVLRLQQRRASKSFIAECRALRSIRHRNIVKILTVCSSLDFSGSDFKALVVEYMPNGSLDSWLHPSANEDEHHQLKNLSLVQRLNVAIDIACALDYLHNHCEAPIIHCDLKPNNVLLDDDMVAHVSDFGLARILSEDIDYSQSQTNSLAIKGTIGYVAPEYGMGANTSTSGDVYSYGIVLLEMLTGKRPSDDIFANNLSLHQFAKMALPERVMEIIDHRLLAEEIEIIRHGEDYEKIRNMMQESLISLVKIGLSCSHESPKERMEMKDVVIEMQKVRDFYLRR
ncbi:putative receptor-like protein kinase [Cinnamomum micranthum f. kanehirae]|uniref:non-specific serine/threonine protein kinase n=1 Tax=Cinnamomum micranthum f. kanehirae TaxID=337451 RepID=A0A3S3NNH2_9MAGN|nr:putative receptor-like protein kinase [Cinnamomum micranthum f. kanehirae]